MARTDWVPKEDDALFRWSQNLEDNIVSGGAELGMSSTDIAAQRTSLGRIRSAITAADTAKRASLDATAAKRRIIREEISGTVRPAMGRVKTAPGYEESTGLRWGIVGPENPFDPHTYKPRLEAHVHPTGVELRFEKDGVEA